jgi:lysophospholipase L1-like esterase
MTNFEDMCKHILIVLLAFGVMGCASTTDIKPIVKNKMSTTTKSYLALGDSYTIGTSIASQDNFPNQLVDSLLANTGDTVSVKIIAQNGWRTDDLQRGIKRTDLEDRYDLVSLLIGVNNQYQGLPIADFEKDFRSLLDSSVKYSGGIKTHIFVVSIPNYGYTPFGAPKKEEITTDLTLFNTRSKSICEEYGIDFYNITDISLEAETNADFRAKDDLHPSGTQYAAWVSSFLDEVIKKLE